MEELFTIKSLAALLRVSPSTIRREINSGRIRSFKVRGQVRFTYDDVQDYLNLQDANYGQSNSADVLYLAFNRRN